MGLLDPDSLAERMAAPGHKGVLSEEFRFRSVEGSWIWVRQMVVGVIFS